MFSRRFSALRLAPKLTLITRDSTAEAQQTELQEAVRRHNSIVKENTTQRHLNIHNTYDETAAVFYPALQLMTLPPTSGVHRSSIRQALAADIKNDFLHCVVNTWKTAAVRQAVIVGCRSLAYLKRQLETDQTFSLLVIDHTLSALLEAAITLVPLYGTRVQFIRSDALFLLHKLLPPTIADVCIAPMPVPFWSESGSYRRLVTRDFLCVVHQLLKVREDPTDARGFVTFTDVVPLAEFMMEQLEESRLIVPWTRKNPAETYGRWLPLQTTKKTNSREFEQQRLGETVAFAASKNGPTSAQAVVHIQSLDYKRRYYRELAPPTE
ncbi:hypothetical protein LSM04_000280 [Trypanosoma melophagium]|uniref:uncharacterized protein n=1 Tax=Trypanosoma melophagium TaxID=715481 RepID=UPI00351A92A8|nr:hypothetical protein LSM04_000280 [Trypanosoma melophagium]